MSTTGTRHRGLFLNLRLDPNVLHQMVQYGFGHVHLADDAERTNLSVMHSRPAADIVFDMMEQRIRSAEFATDRIAVLGMLSGMNEFRSFEE